MESFEKTYDTYDISKLIYDHTKSTFPNIKELFPPRDEDNDPEEINLRRYDANNHIKERSYVSDCSITKTLLFIRILIEVIADELKKITGRYRYRELETVLQGSFPCGLRIGPVIELDYQFKLIPLCDEQVVECTERGYKRHTSKLMSVHLKNDKRENLSSKQILDEFEWDMLSLLRNQDHIKNCVAEKALTNLDEWGIHALKKHDKGLTLMMSHGGHPVLLDMIPVIRTHDQKLLLCDRYGADAFCVSSTEKVYQDSQQLPDYMKRVVRIIKSLFQEASSETAKNIFHRNKSIMICDNEIPNDMEKLFGKESYLPSYLLNIVVLYAYNYMRSLDSEFNLGNKSLQEGKHFSTVRFCCFVLHALQTICKHIIETNPRPVLQLDVQYPYGIKHGTTNVKIKNVESLFPLFQTVLINLDRLRSKRPYTALKRTTCVEVDHWINVDAIPRATYPHRTYRQVWNLDGKLKILYEKAKLSRTKYDGSIFEKSSLTTHPLSFKDAAITVQKQVVALKTWKQTIASKPMRRRKCAAYGSTPHFSDFNQPRRQRKTCRKAITSENQSPPRPNIHQSAEQNHAMSKVSFGNRKTSVSQLPRKISVVKHPSAQKRIYRLMPATHHCDSPNQGLSQCLIIKPFRKEACQ